MALVHAEVSPDDFKRNDGPLEMKMTPPRYVGLQHEQIPRCQWMTVGLWFI